MKENTLGQKKMEQDGKELVIKEKSAASIHPDLEQGIQAILHDDIPRAIKEGRSGSALPVVALNFVNALKAGRAGLSPEGRKEVAASVAEEIRANINAGLQSTLTSLVSMTQRGYSLDLLEPKYREIERLCDLAEGEGIDINFFPEEPGEEGSKALIEPLKNKTEILAYAHDVVDRNLLLWMGARLESFKHEVERGTMDIVTFDTQVEEWLQAMAKGGFKVVDIPEHPHPSTEAALHALVSRGLLRREINKADIFTLRNGIIEGGLARGVERSMAMIKFSISTGVRDPIKDWLGFVSAYITEAEKRDLIDTKSPVLCRQGKINPDLVDVEVRKIVEQNISTGIEKLNTTYLAYIREANLGLLQFNRDTLDQYFEIAKEYGVTIENPVTLREKGSAYISAENIQAGIQAILEYAKTRARAGDMHLLRYQNNKTGQMKALAQRHGLESSVDFEELDTYLNAVGVFDRQLKQ